ncbi:hypothetical protein L1987_59195 [Smallanthus sonchifolius]|uniref:Uncharacterized protein n=1 Tax=Smallanthus sonchifolius TaxID=185202 RepID=A0ACB9D578_9ASTR|nr:hypothetical protein L1987_59195 [Smallanthus sonchifolius]
MACMKLGSKADAFQKQGQAWFCTTGLPSDIVVEVEDMSFHLHKFPLLSRSGVMEKLIADASEKGDTNCAINLKDIPGGAKTFELVAKFCYGVKHEITASNVVHLRCAAEHLEMIEQYGEDNLISQTEIFFNRVVLKNWKDSLKSLQTCGNEDIKPHAEELNITKRCIESLAVKASTDPNLFGWPMIDHGGPMQSPGDSLLLTLAMEARGIKQEIIAGSLEYYAKKYLPGLSRRKSAPVGPSANDPPPEEDQKILLEEIDHLLPMQKGLAVPEYARPMDDGLYRAIDIYLKSHPWLADSDREQLCRLMDCQKLSLEACTHAAQNERLPLRIIVQVLFFEQLQLRTSIAGCFLVSDNLADGSRQFRSGLGAASQEDGWTAAVTENQVLKVGMDSMRMRVSELENECSDMKQEIEKLGRVKGGSGAWSNMSKKFGFKLKSQMCSAQEGSVSKQDNSIGKLEKGRGKIQKHKKDLSWEG